jgi:hypothetical protein
MTRPGSRGGAPTPPLDAPRSDMPTRASAVLVQPNARLGAADEKRAALRVEPRSPRLTSRRLVVRLCGEKVREGGVHRNGARGSDPRLHQRRFHQSPDGGPERRRIPHPEGRVRGRLLPAAAGAAGQALPPLLRQRAGRSLFQSGVPALPLRARRLRPAASSSICSTTATARFSIGRRTATSSPTAPRPTASASSRRASCFTVYR